MTEKLIVVLFAILLVGGALMVFGPMLSAKYQIVATMLGSEPEPMRTLADGKIIEPEGTNPIWYVIFTFGVVAFFAVFIAPMLFPRARRTRQAVILDLLERMPWLAPLIDADMLADEKLGELRGLAAEVNALEKHKEKALDIQPHDFGKMALPSEQTVDASFSEMPDLEALLGDEPTPARSVRRSGPNKSLSLRNGPAPDESEDTQMAIPLSQRLQAIEGDDEIPFDAIDPSLKPQLQPLDHKPRNPSRGIPVMGIPANEDSTTVDVGTPRDILGPELGDKLAARVLRESGALQAIPDDDMDATIIRDSQPLEAASPNDRTALVEPLDPRHVRSGPLAAPDSTTPDRIRGPGAPDATTQDYKSYDSD